MGLLTCPVNHMAVGGGTRSNSVEDRSKLQSQLCLGGLVGACILLVWYVSSAGSHDQSSYRTIMADEAIGLQAEKIHQAINSASDKLIGLLVVNDDSKHDGHGAAKMLSLGRENEYSTWIRRSVLKSNGVRIQEPEKFYTLDYRPDRVNVHVDAENKITKVSKG